MLISLKTIIVALLVGLMSVFYKYLNKATNQIKSITMPAAEHFAFKKSSSPLPIFFFSHGGPTFADRNDLYGSNAGAWDMTKKVGDYIKNSLKPDFIIVVSAHWQTEAPDEIEVSVPGIGEAFYTQNQVSSKLRPDENALIYDFYGFPKKFYQNQFHSLSNNVIANDIVNTLKDSDWFQAKTRERGIDHGVFVPLTVAFADTNVLESHNLDVDVPLIQVSLAGTPDIEIHYRLGEALSKYRDQNGLIIFSGMSVHNLRDFGANRNNRPMEYVKPFNTILTNILTNPNKSEILDQLKQLPRKSEWVGLYKESHPTNEHLLPAIVAAGASRGDECKLLYTGETGSLGWNIYRWGNAGDPTL